MNVRRAGALLTLLVTLSVSVRAAEVTVSQSAGRAAARPVSRSKKQLGVVETSAESAGQGRVRTGPPMEMNMMKAHGRKFDLRTLPRTRPVKRERPERQPPPMTPRPLQGAPLAHTETAVPLMPEIHAPAPGPIASFDGLDFATWGAGHPPDTNGDVGPNHYIQTINTAIGVYDKSGAQLAAFSFDTFMSQGNFGNLCDTDNFGDPVVLYDSFEDRWIVSDFAFQFDASGNVANPPGSFQCIAVSMTGDPVTGGWNYYSINTAGGLGDYPKLGIWPDGLYMSVNMFDYAKNGPFQNVRLYALNKAQMYAGSPTVKVVSFDLPSDQFTALPSNARLQTGTPPAGSPNYLVTTGNFLDTVEVWKFHVDWDRLPLSSVTGPFDASTAFWWEQYDRPPTLPSVSHTTAPTPANAVDTLYPRAMVQNQYSNLAGAESLWFGHTVGAGNVTSNLTSTQAAVRYYQVNVTGGAVAPSAPQGFTFSPDTTIYRFMPSVAVDRAGDMAIGYSTSNASTFPTIKYAGRLAGDPANSITQDEQTLINGTGTQSGNCGGTCERWGDYSAMTLDPDGCTFWYTSEYYVTTGLNFQTRIGSFAFPSCTPVGSAGTLSGTVKSSLNNSNIAGAAVKLGSRVAVTNALGAFTFTSVPIGTYPLLTASAPGFNSASVATVPVPGGSQNVSLSPAVASSCPTDTSQSDFQTGTGTNIDLDTAPNSVTLSKTVTVEQNTDVTFNGFSFTNTLWAGQTFVAPANGSLTNVDLNLFCFNCTGTPPNITISIRATSAGVPTGGDLATATIPGFTSGSGGYVTATFSTPLAVTATTSYAIVVRAAALYASGTFAYVCSCGGGSAVNSNPYANGSRVTSSNSGAAWVADTTSGGRDLGFHVYIVPGFASSGELISGPKDGNPAPGFGTAWSTMTWNASVPANSTLKFQVAGSSSADGPFNFVGPDGTAATFFTTSPATLTAFNNVRFLEYRAIFTSTSLTASATLNDVTLCFTSAAGPAAPTSTVALGNGAPSVSITWLPSVGATNYHIYRRDDTKGFKLVGTTASLSFPDTTAGVVANHAYLYMVRAVNLAGIESVDSALDLATTVVFTDPSLDNTTKVKAAHVNELRTAVNAVAALAGNSTFSFTNPVATNGAIKTTQIDQLRTNLNAALPPLGLPTVTFVDPTLTPNATSIFATHVLQLRSAVQ